jgi:hypothetical protein
MRKRTFELGQQVIKRAEKEIKDEIKCGVPWPVGTRVVGIREGCNESDHPEYIGYKNGELNKLTIWCPRVRIGTADVEFEPNMGVIIAMEGKSRTAHNDWIYRIQKDGGGICFVRTNGFKPAL